MKTQRTARDKIGKKRYDYIRSWIFYDGVEYLITVDNQWTEPDPIPIGTKWEAYTIEANTEWIPRPDL
jgi:hypothetical protein